MGSPWSLPFTRLRTNQCPGVISSRPLFTLLDLFDPECPSTLLWETSTGSSRTIPQPLLYVDHCFCLHQSMARPLESLRFHQQCLVFPLDWDGSEHYLSSPDEIRLQPQLRSVSYRYWYWMLLLDRVEISSVCKWTSVDVFFFGRRERENCFSF